MKDVITIGMCTYDEIILLDSYPMEDQKCIAQEVVTQYGGMAT